MTASLFQWAPIKQRELPKVASISTQPGCKPSRPSKYGNIPLGVVSKLQTPQKNHVSSWQEMQWVGPDDCIPSSIIYLLYLGVNSFHRPGMKCHRLLSIPSCWVLGICLPTLRRLINDLRRQRWCFCNPLRVAFEHWKTKPRETLWDV